MGSVFISGATSGIGLETAKLFAEKKYSLIINGRRRERLEELQKELRVHAPVTIACFDVSDKKAMERWFAEHKEAASDIEILVNSAGLALGTDPLQRGNTDDWESMIDTNIKGLLFLTRQILPAFVEKKKGHVINIGSVAGRWVYPGGAVYAATKFSVRAISEALRLDVIGTGIRVTNIEPGMVDTEFSQVRFKDKEKAANVYKGMTPLSGRDVAESILWTAERPAHINIQELMIYPTDQASVRDVHRTL